MNNKERIIILLLAALNFTHILDFMIMMPLGNKLMPHFNISAKAFTLLVSAYTISAGISGLIAAFFVDQYDRKKVLMFGYIGFLIGTIACAVAPTYGLLMSARIIAGLFGGLIGAQVLSIVSDLIPYERRASAMGIMMAAFSVSSIVGVPLGIFVSSTINWHAPFYIVAGIGIILLPFLLKYIPKMDGHIKRPDANSNRFEPYLNIFSNKSQLLALSLTSTMMFGHFLIIPFLNPFMEFNMDFSSVTQTPLVYSVGGILTLFSTRYIGKLADRKGKYDIFKYLILLNILPIAFITNMPHIPFYLVLCVTGLWFVISSGRAIPAQAMVSNVVEPHQRGSFMSINSSIQQISVGLASFVSGLIIIKKPAPSNFIVNYDITGYLSMAVMLFCLMIAYFLNKAMANVATTAQKNSATEKVALPVEETA